MGFGVKLMTSENNICSENNARCQMQEVWLNAAGKPEFPENCTVKD
jgi:hypothetical protein